MLNQNTVLQPTLFFGGRVFDGTGFLPRGTAVAVANGKIAGVGGISTFEGFDGARVDCSNQTLLPGLMDCHAHLTLSGEHDYFFGARSNFTRAELTLRALANAQACLAGGVTSIRDCGGVDHIEFAVRNACNAGIFLGPTIKAAGQCICMTGGTNYMVGRTADGPHEIVKAIREQIHHGCDCIKLMATGAVLTPNTDIEQSQYTEAELRAGVEEARRFNRPVACHAIGNDGALNAARAGVNSIEHGVFLDEACIAEMLKNDVFLVPTLGPFARFPELADSSTPQAILDKNARACEQHANSVRNFYRAGGKIAMGADTGVPYNPHGENAKELWHMVDVGMSPTDALVAGTSNAAELLRMDTRGSIKAGYAADLLLVSGDPELDIRAVSDRKNHAMVMKDGIVAFSAGR